MIHYLAGNHAKKMTWESRGASRSHLSQRAIMNMSGRLQSSEVVLDSRETRRPGSEPRRHIGVTASCSTCNKAQLHYLDPRMLANEAGG